MKQLIHIFIWLILVLTLFVSCEEYYNPKLDVVPGLLVVESHVTNSWNENYVKITKASDFYNTGLQEPVAGASVYLIESGGSTNGLPVQGIETGAGYFIFPKTPIIGKNYILRIVYGKDTYESDVVAMPPLPAIDTLYTNHKVNQSYQTDAYGKPMEVETPGREICVDAPIWPDLKYYKFKWRAIIQWMYSPSASGSMLPPPPVFGWISYYQSGLFNIAGPKEFSSSDKVKNHQILFLGYDSRVYLDSAAEVPQGWIVIIDQYGISKESYDFHEKLNKQFSADGSLFDPVLTQVYGNIHCVTDPTKQALGFFDLCSYRQYRYFMSMGSGKNSKGYQRRMNRYFEIPGSGSTVGNPPEFWESFY